VVTISNGVPTTTSFKVAEKFGKRHDHVLRDIDNIIASLEQFEDTESQLPKIGELEIIDKNALGKIFTRRYFSLDRDAFSLLVMGFTGQKALKFKLDFLQAFNALEAEVLEQAHGQQTGPIDPDDTIALFSALQAKVEQYGETVKLLAPKKKPGMSIRYNSQAITKVAKKLNLRFRGLLEQLISEGILEKRNSGLGYWVESSMQQLFHDRGKALYVSDAGVEYLKARIEDGSLAVKCLMDYTSKTKPKAKTHLSPKPKPKPKPKLTENSSNKDPFNFEL
jgi:Rha family phage regulatory protein